MSTQYNKLKDTLREMFQMDQADLDFGIYRIMNAKRAEIEKFIDNDLLPQIKTELVKFRGTEVESKKKELEKVITTLRENSADVENNPKVLQLQDEIARYGDNESLENEVFSHLTTFFRRYYDEGDFLSLRRYKKDTYAIPYEGEEVKLHWANADQYYIKTTEFLRDYVFFLPNGNKIHFKLIDATEEKDNIKADKDKERKFQLYTEEPIRIEGKDLFIQFVYLSDKEKQENHNQTALGIIQQEIKTKPGSYQDFIDLIVEGKAASQKNPKRSLLEKHLNSYTARFNFDFFIHKDLGTFLRRELDFYIKNEVLFVDDLDAQDENKLKSVVAKVKVTKHIAQKIITFLAQLEDFQKKLWLKKKFVINSGYCVTLDRIPVSLYPEILSNDAQRDEWIKLFAIDEIQGDLVNPGYATPLTLEFLKSNPFLVLDTKHFDTSFKERLIASFDNLDESCDGLIIHSENYQALNLLQEKYKKKIVGIYADPPYNAKSSEILYKNTFKHSSWISFIFDRLSLASKLKSNDGALITAIDENEFTNLLQIFICFYPNWEKSCISIVHNPAGVQGDNFSYSHEYAIYAFENKKNLIGKTERAEESEEAFRDWGGTCARSLAKNCFYPIYVKNNEITGFGDVCPDDFHPGASNIAKNGIVEVYPVGDDGEERKWVFARDSVEGIYDDLIVKDKNGLISISRIKTKTSYKTVWNDKKYYANIYGSKLLNNIIGNKKFDFPKSIYTVQDCLFAINSFRDKSALALDYFAGSGTTGHAVINLNRVDGGNRKFILIEMGDYFRTVLTPRIQKVIYATQWKDGKPQELNSYIDWLRKGITEKKKEIKGLQGFDSKENYEFEKQRLVGEIISNEELIKQCEKDIDCGNKYGGVSQCFKYFQLESYDDTLDNLALNRTQDQQNSLLQSKQAKEEYILSYMLDIETKGSDSLLNIDKFTDPFHYTLKIRQNNELKDTEVDLIETFNYLIGLYVEQTETIRGFKVLRGKLRTGEKTLVIWRNTNEKSNDDLDEFFQKQKYNTLDFEFDLIFVNGDNNFENLKVAEDKWKVRLIEEEFKKRMFEVEA